MSRKKKAILKRSGITTDNKPMYTGVYNFYETHGLPLETLLCGFLDKGFIPDWIDFYENAISGGMAHDRILSKLEEAICDSFGKQFSDVVISKLDELFGK